jgi:magnesium transporter
MIRGLGLYFDGHLQDDEHSVFAGEIPGDSLQLREQLAKLYAQAQTQRGQFVWIGLFEPARAELQLVEDVFELPTLQVEDAGNHRQRPKVEFEDNSALVIVKILSYYDQTSDVETGQLSIFIGRHFIVTVRYGPLGDISKIRRRLEGHPEFLKHGPTAVAHAILDATVDAYIAVSEEISKDIEQLEESVFSPERTSDAEMIYRVKRENLEMRRAVQPLVGMANALVREDVPGIPEEMLAFYRDLGDHVLRVADAADNNDQLLMTLLMAATSRQDLQQNNDMRRISAYVAIAAVPTMIAGIYGMNFDFMPELHWKYGYLAIVGLMLTACLVMYRAFKKSGWL